MAKDAAKIEQPDADPSAATAADIEIYCPRCGYDLRGLSPGTCPECGEAFDPAELRRSQIPWSRRGEGGPVRRCFRAYFRGYWPTVWMVMFRTKRFCREIAKPVNYRDARWFQVITLGHIYVALLMFTASFNTLVNDHEVGLEVDEFDVIRWATLQVWPLTVLQGLLLLFMLFATGVHTYWFHPRTMSASEQNRAISLGYYCCAPFALMPVAGILSLAVVIGLPDWDDILHSVNGWMTGIVLGVVLSPLVVLGCLTMIAGWWLPLRVARIACNRSIESQIVMFATLPLVWALLAFVILGVVPSAIFWLWVVVKSLA